VDQGERVPCHLFIDVLVDASASNCRVKDEEDYEAAIANGWLSPAEAKAARDEVTRFVEEISRGRLVPWLDSVCSLEPRADRPQSEMRRVPVPSRLAIPRRWGSQGE
jgi:hypothetical protein